MATKKTVKKTPAKPKESKTKIRHAFGTCVPMGECRCQ